MKGPSGGLSALPKFLIPGSQKGGTGGTLKLMIPEIVVTDRLLSVGDKPGRVLVRVGDDPGGR